MMLILQETTLPTTPNIQLLRMPEIESIPAVNHFTPQAQVAPHPQPIAAPLTIPTTTRETQQDPRLVHDPRLAIRDPRSSTQPQWQTAVVHPAVQVKPQVQVQPPHVHVQPPQVHVQPSQVHVQPPQVHVQPSQVQTPPVECSLPVTASSSVSSSKSDSSLSGKESKDEKAKKSPAKPTEKLTKQPVAATKKIAGNVMKVEPKTNVVVKKDDKRVNSGATTKTVESARKSTSGTSSSSSEKRTTRADSRTRTRTHVGDRSKEKIIIRDPRKDVKAKAIVADARPRSRSPRTIRLPREHADRRYRSNRSSFDGDHRRRHSHESSPPEKKDAISSRSAEKHKLGRIRGHPLENSVQDVQPRKEGEGAKTDATWHKTIIDVDAGPAAKRMKQDVPPKDEIHDPLPDDLA